MTLRKETYVHFSGGYRNFSECPRQGGAAGIESTR